ncbi:MAG: glycosyltransferase family 4 protein [Acidobacteriota bacterium]|nr:glycosyltransferase family 4 protein [Acidobacteriota bacterium]
MKERKPKILILSDFYLPAFKSGALRTVVNMVERMSDEFDFWVLTGNRDSDGDQSRFSGVQLNHWQQVGKARVFYASPDQFNLKNIAYRFAEAEPDAVYLNSFFSALTVKFLFLRRLGTIRRFPVILAPEGEFSKGAIALKGRKKRSFLALALPFGLYDNLIWKAVSDAEKEDIVREIGKRGEILIAANMPPRMILEDFEVGTKPRKKSGEARFIFLSRISPKKNLKFALTLLKGAPGQVTFDIYGSIEDEKYWAECESVIKVLPETIKVNFQGAISHDKVAETFARYHFFLFPTLGENFGHVVIESLAAGTPVLLSDQTPWRNLENGNIGWDLPLEDVSNWSKTIRQCVEMPESDFNEMAQSAREFAVDWLAALEIETANRQVLRRALEISKV